MERLKMLPEIMLRISNGKKSICVQAYVQEELKRLQITDALWEVSCKKPTATLEDWLKEVSNKYEVDIKKTDVPPLENVKNCRPEQGTIYLRITKKVVA